MTITSTCVMACARCIRVWMPPSAASPKSSPGPISCSKNAFGGTLAAKTGKNEAAISLKATLWGIRKRGILRQKHSDILILTVAGGSIRFAIEANTSSHHQVSCCPTGINLENLFDKGRIVCSICTHRDYVMSNLLPF